jgi:16S rRNA (adenine1518-N6/adenine1519-N6)-dimethyltransferase
MTNPDPSIPALLKRYDIKPDKRLGQNFLVSPSALSKVVDAAKIQPGDWVLEIGAGIGNLTILLAGQAGKVVAVETDHRLIPPLTAALSPFDNVQIICKDILQVNLPQVIGGEKYKVVANIPYNITSAIFRYLLESPLKPASITLTVQKEVAHRICAAPGDLSILALSVQVFGDPQPGPDIPASAFYPKPKVDSKIVHVLLFTSPLVPEPQLDTFFRLVKAGFSQKRKTLRNSLSAGMGWSPAKAGQVLESTGIDPRTRAQSLSIHEWGRLTSLVFGQDQS